MAVTPHTVSLLRDSVDGEVITPDRADRYETARPVVAGIADLHPAAIVRPGSVADIQAVIRLAQDTDADLAVRGGGHSSAGHGTVEDGIVLDMSALTALRIDPQARTARVGAGLSAGELTRATARHGLAVPLGDAGPVGVAGITLGGGLGPLARKHGMSIDSLRAADIVTADGRHRTIDAEHDADLFWAIRGGGGNLGVITSLDFALHDVSRTVGGTLVLPAEPGILVELLAEAQRAPRELTTLVTLWPCPPFPFVPPEHHGTLVLSALLVHVGDPDDGERALAPFRRLGAPVADLLGPAHYPDLLAEPPVTRATTEVRTRFLDGIDHATAASLIAGIAQSPAATSMLQVRVLGGAVREVPNDATAFGFRHREMVSFLAGSYVGNQGETAAWADRLAATLDPGNDTFLNFLGPSDTATVTSAFPAETWHRLTRVKTAYDPGNLFRRNHNVPPARMAVDSLG